MESHPQSWTKRKPSRISTAQSSYRRSLVAMQELELIKHRERGHPREILQKPHRHPKHRTRHTAGSHISFALKSQFAKPENAASDNTSSDDTLDYRRHAESAQIRIPKATYNEADKRPKSPDERNKKRPLPAADRDRKNPTAMWRIRKVCRLMNYVGKERPIVNELTKESNHHWRTHRTAAGELDRKM